MAIYHLSFSILKRSDGKSSCYLSAYNTRSKIVDNRTGDVWDYTKKSGLDYHEVLLPKNGDKKYLDPAVLWNHLEDIEKRKDAQLSKYFDLAIPVELSREEKINLVKEYCHQNFVSKNIVCDISFHDLESDNPHAHVMTTLRPMINGKFDKKLRNFQDKDLINRHRENWADIANKYLTPYNKKISHKTLDNQRIEHLEKSEECFSKNEPISAVAHLIIAEGLDRDPMFRINRKVWNTPEAQEQRKKEQDIAQQKFDEAKAFASNFVDIKNIAKKAGTFEVFKNWMKKSLLEIFDNIRKQNKKEPLYNKQAFTFKTLDQRKEELLINASKTPSIASKDDLATKLSKHIAYNKKIAQEASEQVDLKTGLPKLK